MACSAQGLSKFRPVVRARDLILCAHFRTFGIPGLFKPSQWICMSSNVLFHTTIGLGQCMGMISGPREWSFRVSALVYPDLDTFHKCASQSNASGSRSMCFW